MKTPLPEKFADLLNDDGFLRPEYKDTHIEFKKGAEDWEIYPESGMRAVLIGARPDHDGVIRLSVDYYVWSSRNLEFESANYWDKSVPARACLTARQAGFYNQQDTIYVMADQTIAEFFGAVPEEETAEHRKYTVVVSGTSHVDVRIDRIETDDIVTALANYKTPLCVFRGWPDKV
jgi:hypothetical protein